jgi:hypothetical protein
MTNADRIARQHEDNKKDVTSGGKVDALYKPTGERAEWDIHRVGTALMAYPNTRKLPICSVEQLVILKVLRRGF